MQFYENDKNQEHSADNVYEINLIELYFQITSNTRLQLSSLLQVQYSLVVEEESLLTLGILLHSILKFLRDIKNAIDDEESKYDEN